jgi:hypothetical protein
MDSHEELLENMDKVMMQIMTSIPDSAIESQVLRMVLVYRERHGITMYEAWEHFAKLLLEQGSE